MYFDGATKLANAADLKIFEGSFDASNYQALRFTSTSGKNFKKISAWKI